MKNAIIFISLAITLTAASCSKKVSEPMPESVSYGFVADYTHSQALVGISKGFFEKELDGVNLQPVLFANGVAVMRSLVDGSLDLAYVDPVPVILQAAKDDPGAIRIIAGACSGGVRFVTQKDIEPGSKSSLMQSSIAVSALNTTTHIALRHYLRGIGVRTTEQGGGLRIVPVDVTDMMLLFARNTIDGAWLHEPWASRLITQAGGVNYLNEASLWTRSLYTSAVLVASKRIVEQYPGFIRKFLMAHVRTTQWINSNKEESLSIINKEIEQLTGIHIDERTAKAAFRNVFVSYDPIKPTVERYARKGRELGLISSFNSNALFELAPLDTLLSHEGLPLTKKIIN